MPSKDLDDKLYTIKETAKISGLPESTLRFYESIGLIEPIQRDENSKYRTYTEDNVNQVIAIACLNATGLSIDDMRMYLINRKHGIEGALSQIALLEKQSQLIAEEIHAMKLRQEYVEMKIKYWQAVSKSDSDEQEKTGSATYEIATRMKLPKPQ